MDFSKLREEDVPYVREVVDYLRGRQLEVLLGGSALLGDKKYGDVDLLATGSREAVASAYFDLTSRDARTESFPQKAANGQEYEVLAVGGEKCYIGISIDERVVIRTGIAPITEIDLSFKVAE